MKGNVTIEIIVAVALATIVVGFIVVYMTSHSGGDIQKTEIDAQIARCCSKILSTKNPAGDYSTVKCVDDPKLVKVINARLKDTGESYNSPAPLGALISSGMASDDEIKEICGISGND